MQIHESNGGISGLGWPLAEGWGWGSFKDLQRTEKALPGVGGSPEQWEPPEKGVGGPFCFILLPLENFYLLLVEVFEMSALFSRAGWDEKFQTALYSASLPTRCPLTHQLTWSWTGTRGHRLSGITL